MFCFREKIAGFCRKAAMVLIACLPVFHEAGAHDCTENCSREKGHIQIGYTVGSALMESLIPLLSKAYKQIGHDVVFLPHPSNRSLSHLEDGILDAEIARLSVVEKKIGNIVRINIPIHTLKGFAYTNRGEIEEYTPEILGHYRLTSLRGVLWSDRVVTNHPRSNQMTQPADLLRLLQEGRTDIIFLAEETMDRLLENHPATSVKIRKLYPAIAIQPMYHYIHKKHRDLVPELEKAISDILKNRK